MHSDRHIWQAWASRLQQLGVTSFVATFLDVGGPLNILTAQLIYVSQPVLQWFIPRSQIDGLARLLEEPESARSFAAYLRENAS
jgi:hypothetical protein